MTQAKRQPVVLGDIAIIPLTRGETAIIDLIDLPLAQSFSWSCRTSKYVFRAERRCGKSKTIFLHRAVLGVRDSKVLVDHIDGNPLNNTRRNLRIATPMQNQGNRVMDCDNRAGFKGVSFYKRHQKFTAQIRQDGRKRHLGYFDTAEEAHAAYFREAKAIFGEFARSA